MVTVSRAKGPLLAAVSDLLGLPFTCDGGGGWGARPDFKFCAERRQRGEMCRWRTGWKGRTNSYAGGT